MALNDQISISLADKNMFGIGVIDAVITEEGYTEGRRSMTVKTISPLKTPYSNSDPKADLEFSRYKQDCRKRALDLAHGEREYPSNQSPLERQLPVFKSAVSVLKSANEYYNWLISIPQ